MNDIAKRIEEVSIRKKVSYKELAEILDITPQTIYQILNGRVKNPSSSLIAKFEKVGVNSSWLLTGEGNIFKTESSPSDVKVEDNYQTKYIELLEITNKLWTIIAQNGIKVELGKWLDVSYSRFVFFMNLKYKFRYIIVAI